MTRKIIHIDMDAFYASVELRDRPELRRLPVVVAYDRPRSVLTTASYAARQYGCHSAMSLSKARQLCPQVICIEPDFSKYRAVSQQLHQIFNQYTHKIEPLSLDEAYLDVTDNLRNLPSATAVAECIRADITRITGLTASAGVAPNKFLAKIASDWHKPNGLCIIKPSQVQQFIQPLSLSKLPGVGHATVQKMHALGWHTVADIQQVSMHKLTVLFGKLGQRIFGYAQGIDERPVQWQRERQQISKETTFLHNHRLATLAPIWQDLTAQVWQHLQRKQLSARGVQVKLKTHEFKVLQHGKSYRTAFADITELQQAVEQLVMQFQAYAQTPLRLAGVGVFALEEIGANTQLSFFKDLD